VFETNASTNSAIWANGIPTVFSRRKVNQSGS
jgi:hypothetical protein